MKRHALIVSALSLTVALVGCKGSSTGNTDGQDSLPKQEEVIEANAEEEFSSADLKFFDLKGHVKQVVVTRGGSPVTITFDEEGNYASYETEFCKLADVKRDDAGRIFQLDFVDLLDRPYSEVYEYGEDGLIVKSSCDAEPDGLAFEHNYTYSDGLLSKIVGFNDGPGNLEISFEYNGQDEKGNWTKRTRSLLVEGETEPNVEEESREITYYE